MKRYFRSGLTKGKHSEKRTYHPVYKAWQNMLSRCTNPRAIGYNRYGGRGITVCERWRVSANFVEDMLPTWFCGATIDRIDNDGNYTPENCKWVSREDNLRKQRRTNFVEYEGELLTVRQLSQRVTGVSYQTILRRVHKGLPISEVIKPV